MPIAMFWNLSDALELSSSASSRKNRLMKRPQNVQHEKPAIELGHWFCSKNSIKNFQAERFTRSNVFKHLSHR